MVALLALSLGLLSCQQPSWTTGVDHWVLQLEGMGGYYADQGTKLYLFPDTDKESSYGDVLLVSEFGGYSYGYAMDGRFGGEISGSSMEVDVVLDYAMGWYYGMSSWCPFHVSGDVDSDGTVSGQWEGNDVELAVYYCMFFYYASEAGGSMEGYAE